MCEEDHGSLPDGVLEESELSLHGIPLHLVEGGGGGDDQQDDVWVAESESSAELLGHSGVWCGVVGQPSWGVHHCHLVNRTQLRSVKT